MNHEQKHVILQEIRFWKQSKLLPSEYCDFLMNLYGEGDSFTADQTENKESRPKRAGGGFFRSRPWNLVLLSSGALLLFLIFVFNFTLFPMAMQIGVLVLGTFFSYYMAFRGGRGQSLRRLVWNAAAAMFLGLDGYYYLYATGELSNLAALGGVMSCVFVLWIISGGIGRSRMIAGFGWGGLLLLFGGFLEQTMRIGESSYGIQHFYWLIPAFLSLFAAYLLGRGRVYIAPSFLAIGVLALFGPDLRLLAFHTSITFFVQAIIFLKLALLLSLFIVFRPDLKRWLDTMA
jgi:hypothetical protein